MTKITVGTAIGSNVVGKVSGGILLAGTSAEGSRDYVSLLAEFREHCEAIAGRLPSQEAAHVREAAMAAEVELAKNPPDHGRVRALMEKVLAKVQSLTGFADLAISLTKNIAQILSKLPT